MGIGNEFHKRLEDMVQGKLDREQDAPVERWRFDKVAKQWVGYDADNRVVQAMNEKDWRNYRDVTFGLRMGYILPDSVGDDSQRKIKFTGAGDPYPIDAELRMAQYLSDNPDPKFIPTQDKHEHFRKLYAVKGGWCGGRPVTGPNDGRCMRWVYVRGSYEFSYVDQCPPIVVLEKRTGVLMVSPRGVLSVDLLGIGPANKWCHWGCTPQYVYARCPLHVGDRPNVEEVCVAPGENDRRPLIDARMLIGELNLIDRRHWSGPGYGGQCILAGSLFRVVGPVGKSKWAGPPHEPERVIDDLSDMWREALGKCVRCQACDDFHPEDKECE